MKKTHKENNTKVIIPKENVCIYNRLLLNIL